MSPASHRLLAYACLALSMAVVGSYVALSKVLVAVFPVFLLAWLRFAIAAVAMVHWVPRQLGEAALSSRDKRLLFWESFFGNFLFSICMLWGVSMTSALAAGIIMASIPAVVALLSWLLLREQITLRIWGAIACAVTGIAILSLARTMDAAAEVAVPADGNRALWGNLLLFAAVCCEATYVVIGKRLTANVSAKRISALVNVWGLVLATPLGLYVAVSFDFGVVTLNLWAMLLFYAIAASIITVWLWMTGLKHVPAASAGIFTVMLPISAAAVGVIVLGERLTPAHAVAFALALLGVMLATLPERTAAILPRGI